MGYLIMDEWLNQYAYRIDLGVWTFFASGAGAMITALVTVKWQARSAAVADPVEAIRRD